MILAARALALALGIASSASAGDAPPLRAWTRGATPALAGVEVTTGRRVDLRDLRGRVVLVEFWASWCEPCAEALPALARLEARHAGRPLAVLTVNFGEAPERVRAFLREHRLELPVLADREQALGRAWGVGGLPMAFLVDAAGRVRSSTFGEVDWTTGDAAAALARLLAEAERRGARRDPVSASR